MKRWEQIFSVFILLLFSLQVAGKTTAESKILLEEDSITETFDVSKDIDEEDRDDGDEASFQLGGASLPSLGLCSFRTLEFHFYFERFRLGQFGRSNVVATVPLFVWDCSYLI